MASNIESGLFDIACKTKALHAETYLLSGAKMLYKVLHYGHKVVKSLTWIAGIFFLSCCLFAFTTGPFYLYHFLGTGNSVFLFRPQAIVLMGGTPMPSESALIRCYTVRELHKKFPEATIYISQLKEEKQTMGQTSAYAMSEEIRRGFADSIDFRFITDAHSTREEALNIKRITKGIRKARVVLVTSPEHMYRAVAAFRRAGYKSVGGVATFGWAGNADFRYRDRSLGGRDLPLGVGENLQLRYQFWNHLRYQLLCYREILALWWYRFRGWA